MVIYNCPQGEYNFLTVQIKHFSLVYDIFSIKYMGLISASLTFPQAVKNAHIRTATCSSHTVCSKTS